MVLISVAEVLMAFAVVLISGAAVVMAVPLVLMIGAVAGTTMTLALMADVLFVVVKDVAVLVFAELVVPAVADMVSRCVVGVFCRRGRDVVFLVLLVLVESGAPFLFCQQVLR